MKILCSARIAVFASIVLHGLLIFWWFLYFPSPKRNVIGQKKAYLQVHLVTAPSKVLVNKQISAIRYSHTSMYTGLRPSKIDVFCRSLANCQQALALSRKKTDSIQKNRSKSLMAIPRKTHNNSHPLLVLIYQAIAAHAVYPRELQYRSRASVTLAFTLLPNGQVTHLHIQHASGELLLDRAALRAVQAAQPFLQAHLYLTSAQVFVVTLNYVKR